MKDDLFKWLGGLAFLNNVGYSCVWPVTTIYMHNQLHQSLVLAGVVLLCYSSANVIGSIAAGRGAYVWLEPFWPADYASGRNAVDLYAWLAKLSHFVMYFWFWQWLDFNLDQFNGYQSQKISQR